jgi:hypothetical protein
LVSHGCLQCAWAVIPDVAVERASPAWRVPSGSGIRRPLAMAQQQGVRVPTGEPYKPAFPMSFWKGRRGGGERQWSGRRGEGQWSGDRMQWILSFGWWHGGFAEQQHTGDWFVRFLIHRSSCPSDSEFVLTTPKRKSIAPSSALDGRCSICVGKVVGLLECFVISVGWSNRNLQLNYNVYMWKLSEWTNRAVKKYDWDSVLNVDL